jgi:hypothetical protein
MSGNYPLGGLRDTARTCSDSGRSVLEIGGWRLPVLALVGTADDVGNLTLTFLDSERS